MSRASSRALILIPAGLALAALGGCAHAAQTAQRPEYPQKVMVTGSRIPQPVDQRTGIPQVTSSVHFYSAYSLNDTGHYDDLAGALNSAAPDLAVNPRATNQWQPTSFQQQLRYGNRPPPPSEQPKQSHDQPGYDQPQHTTSPHSP